ncbi:MAG: lipopolysaccharide biosynthesis protein [Acidimicrobiales bacterium]|nr:lipopolysaccharide biosynthesis protein [Acidimicrobiales bacterium]
MQQVDAGSEPGAVPLEDTGAPDGGVVARGARWAAGGQVTMHVSRMVITVVLARLILPDERGLFAMALVVTDLLERVVAATPGAGLIHVKALTQRLVSSVFFFNILVGIGIAAVLAAGAPVAASLFGNDDVVPVLRAVGLCFIALSLGQAQRALLRRSFRFRAVAVADVSNALVQGGVSVWLAYRGWGTWALVWGLLAGKLASNVVVWTASSWRPSWLFHWADVRSLRSFSGNLSAFSFFSYFQEAGDKFIVARIGETALGYYMLGYQQLLVPVDAVLSVSRNVLFPAFARMDDDEAIAASFVRSCASVAVLFFPLGLGMTVVAEPFVRVILGDRWLPSVPVLAIFGLIAMINAVSNTTSVLFQSKGRTDLQLRWGVANGLLLLVAYLIGAQWGFVGVAWAFLVGTAICAVPGLMIPFSLIRLPFGRFLSALAPVALATVVMGAAAYSVRLLAEHAGAGWPTVLFSAVATGAVVYGAILLFVRPQAVRDLITLARPKASLT